VQSAGPFDNLPLWGLYVATVAIILLAVEGGQRLGKYRRQQPEHELDAPVSVMVGATLGLLAFMLAFTFGLAASRFDIRRGFVVDDANAIGTTYLRAGLLSEPYRTEVRNLLREYVDVRLELVRPEKAEEAMHRSDELHARLWSQAVAVGEKNPGSIVAGLFIGSLNEVIDLHAKRVNLGLRTRVPGTIWAALYFITILSMGAVGYQAGLTGSRRSLADLALVLAFSAVMMLIADLDNPLEGWLTVSQQAMIDLRDSMMAPRP
jgi:hypothetical protein